MSDITTDEMALALFRLELADPDQEIAVQTLLKKFTLFKDLPTELRRMIFRLMFPGTQRFVIVEDTGEHEDVAWLRLACPPVTANINLESRQETLRVYESVEVEGANFSRPMRRGLWNPQKDIFKCDAFPVVHPLLGAMLLSQFLRAIRKVHQVFRAGHVSLR
ncbi:hypothetical protein IFR05_003948 [Cadophora sp. M221]|nr:hypothetical protein IFR05_003948 [Cadophora sp. M221]